MKEEEIFIADTATVIGEVFLSENVSVWFGAVVRGDSDKISIAKNTNIQDTAIVHVDKGFPVRIGEGVTIGHGAIIHGATIERNCLIGMRATIMNGSIVGENSIVGAHSLVTTGTKIPSNSLVMGTPAKVIRQLTEDEVDNISKSALVYVTKGKEYLNGKYKQSY